MFRIIRLLIKTAAVASIGVISVVVTGVLMLVLLVAIGAGIGSVATSSESDQPTYEHYYGNKESSSTLLSIPITGLILGERTSTSDFSSLLSDSGVVYGYEVKEQLLEAAKQDDIAGVILEIDSPGGTIYGSTAIADGIAAYKEATNKPVVAYVAGMAASGGYWVAAGADKIIADSGTGVGSIGVISGPFKFYDTVMSEDGGAFMGGVVTTGGVKTQYITAGEHKDMGNPYRELDPAEIAALQTMVDDSYEQFVAHVAAGRNIEPATIRTHVQALLYGNTQAEKLNLVDQTGNKQDAYELTASMAQISEYQIKRAATPENFVDALLGARGVGLRLPVATQVNQSSSGHCSFSSLAMAYHGDLFALCR